MQLKIILRLALILQLSTTQALASKASNFGSPEDHLLMDSPFHQLVHYQQESDNLDILTKANPSSSSSDENLEHQLLTLTNQITESYVSTFQDEENSKLSKYMIFKYTISLLGAIGPIIPQIAIPLQIGEDYDSSFLGYFLTVTTCLYIEGVASWLIWELISDGEKLVAAAKGHKAKKGACSYAFVKEVGIGLLALSLGAMSSVPDVYKTYKYNTVKEFAIISFIYDTIPHTIGFYKAFSSLDRANVKAPCKQKSAAIINSIHAVDMSKIGLLKKYKENGTHRTHEDLNQLNSARAIYAYLTEELPNHLSTIIYPDNFLRGIPRNTVRYLAIIPPFATAVGLSMIFSYNGWGLITENKGARISLSILSVFPAFALNTFVLKNVGGILFDKIYFLKNKFPSTEYIPNFYPKLNKVLIFSSFSLAAALSISSFYLIAENLEETFLENAKYFFTTLAVGTDLTFGTYTIYSTMIRYSEAIIRKAKQGSSYVLDSMNKLNNVRASALKSGTEMVSNFWNSLTGGAEEETT